MIYSKTNVLHGMRIIVVGLILAGCDVESGGIERWYSQEQVVKGAAVFAANCAGCHGDRAQGLVTDWQRRQPDGSLPPPPLNGTAHAWHHPLPLLVQIVQEGGGLYNGNMPGFSAQLSETEQYAVIAWIQSQWSDSIYSLWEGETPSLQDGGRQ